MNEAALSETLQRLAPAAQDLALGHPAELRVAFAGGHALISDIGDGHRFDIDLTTEGAP